MDCFMSKKFSVILIVQGVECLVVVVVKGIFLGIIYMVVGDGGGVLLVLFLDQIVLINEQYCVLLNWLVIVDQVVNVICVEMIMLLQVGGFWICEVVFFDEIGICLVVVNLFEFYKLFLVEGLGCFQVINIWLMVSQIVDVQMIVDLLVILVMVEEVCWVGNNVKDYVDDIVFMLENEIREVIILVVSIVICDFWEVENFVGMVWFYSQYVDLNECYLWLMWMYIGENRIFWVVKVDGLNVGVIGGSDMVIFQWVNFFVVQIDVSGEISEQFEQKLMIMCGGIYYYGGVVGKNDLWEIGGDVWQFFNLKELGVMDDVGEYDYEVIVLLYKYMISGKIDNFGEGKLFSVVEVYILLMCWSCVV